MRYDKTNRRLFLQGLGGLLVAIPVLPSLVRDAVANPNPIALNKRFFTIFSEDQLNPHHVFNIPYASLPAYTNGHRSLPITSVSEMCPDLLGPEFEAYASQLSFVRGLNLGVIGHTEAGLMGYITGHNTMGSPVIDTIDSVICRKLGLNPRDAILRLFTDSSASASFADLTNLSVTDNSNPFLIYKNRFTFQPPLPPSGDNVTRRKLVDIVFKDLKDSILVKSFYSTADKNALSDHMDFINDLQTKYGEDAQPPVVSCVEKPNTYFNRTVSMVNPASPDQYKTYVRDCALLIAEAMKCNVYKIGHFGVGSSFLGEVISNHSGSNRTWHLTYGHGNDHESLTELNAWVMKNVFKVILDSLNVEESGGRSFLQNSIIAFAPEMSEAHHQHDMLLILAGEGNGTVSAGRYWDFRDPVYKFICRSYDGVKPIYEVSTPYNRYWNSILQTFGVRPSEYEKPGDPGYGHKAHLKARVTWLPPRLADYVIANEAAYFSTVGDILPGGLFKNNLKGT